MKGDMTTRAVDFAKLGWLTGPIFEKELRIASRRFRYYILRTSYVLLLCMILSALWVSIAALNDDTVTAVYRSMQMSAIARATCGSIIWFQFITLQLLAVVMLSNSISDEIRKRTLDVLASTPITSLQIVLGKLSSRLLQLVLLLALSFPFLAIIRSFGGVPWDFIAAGLAVMLATTILVGSITVLISISNRHAYRTIVSSILVIIAAYSLPPMLAAIAVRLSGASPYTGILQSYQSINPFVAMVAISRSLEIAQPVSFPWISHCLAILGFSAVILGIATFRIRRSAIYTVTGTSDAASLSFFKRFSRRAIAARRNQRRPMMPVTGHPIVWKDSLKDASSYSLSVRLLIVLVVLAMIYGGAAFLGVLGERGFHAAFVGSLTFLGLLRIATGSAVAIAAEKEARAWPILLCTPLENHDIFRAKVIAILKRSMPFWLILSAHLIAFTVAGVLDVLNVIAVIIVVVPPIVFLIGIGLFFGLRLRTQTGAFVATFAVPVVLWFTCPCIGFISNPVIMAGFAVAMPMPLMELFVDSSSSGIAIPALFVFIPAVVYIVVGLIFGISAANTIRRNPF